MYQLNYEGQIYCFDYETDIVEQVLIRHLNYFDFLIQNVNSSSLRLEKSAFESNICRFRINTSYYLFYTFDDQNTVKLDFEKIKWDILNNPNIGLGFVKTLQKELKENINKYSTIEKLIEYEKTLPRSRKIDNVVYHYIHRVFLAKEITEVKNVNVSLPNEFFPNEIFLT